MVFVVKLVTMSQVGIKQKAGSVVHGVTHSKYWSPFDSNYGNGGSCEYPLRTSVEKRIKSKDTTLRLRNKELRIEPTNRCNYSCIMCPRDSHKRAQGIMPMPFFKSIINEGILMGIERVLLSNFGEPFLDPTLEDKIDYCNQHNLKTYIITNASMLHAESKSDFSKGQTITKAEAAIRAGLTELRLSFYGTTSDTYSSIMRGGKFEQVCENILHFKTIREKIGRYGISPTRNIEVLLPEISIYFLDLPQNGEQIKEFLELTKDYADYYEVWKPHNFGSGRANIYRDVETDTSLKTCGRPKSGPLQINWQGIVVPCCYDYNQEVPLGNVALQTIEEVVVGTPYSELRKCHVEGNFKNVPYCNGCDQLRDHTDAIIISTNEIHKTLSPQQIVSRTNTQPTHLM
jgi:MoaA/NifB/PqqE/SkfB family radical SAM enzyme